MEATGNYGKAFAHYLHNNNHDVLIHPVLMHLLKANY